MSQLITIHVMAKAFGDKSRSFNPNDPKEVKKMKDYLKKKIEQGFTLYAMKKGQKDYRKIASQWELDTILTDPNFDRICT